MNMAKITNFLKKIFLNFLKFIKENLKEKLTFIIFIIVFLVISSPIYLGYILGFITKNTWFYGIATTFLALWMGPGTPIFIIILVLTLSIRKIIKLIFNNKKIDTILFDIDGTLINSEIYTIKSKIIEGKKYGYDISEEIVINTLGMSKEISKNYFYSQFDENFPYDELREERYNYIKAALENKEMEYKKGAFELIEYLKNNNYKMALVSSSSKQLIDLYIEHLDLFKEFKIIITGEDTKKGKPHPDSYLLACKKLFSLPANCLVIEDSKNGIIAAKKAKMRSVFIEDYVKLNKEIKDNSTYILNNLEEVITILDKQKQDKKKK